MPDMQRAFVISNRDNVATALEALACGEVRLLGEADRAAVTAVALGMLHVEMNLDGDGQ